MLIVIYGAGSCMLHVTKSTCHASRAKGQQRGPLLLAQTLSIKAARKRMFSPLYLAHLLHLLHSRHMS